MDKEFEVKWMHDIAFRKRKGFSNKTTHALPQRVVPPLYMAGFTSFLTHPLMLCAVQDFSISLPKVRKRPGGLIGLGHLVPELLTTLFTALSHKIRNHLTSSAAKGYPDPSFLFFTVYKRPKLIQLQHIALLPRKQGSRDSGLFCNPEFSAA